MHVCEYVHTWHICVEARSWAQVVLFVCLFFLSQEPSAFILRQYLSQGTGTHQRGEAGSPEILGEPQVPFSSVFRSQAYNYPFLSPFLLMFWWWHSDPKVSKKSPSRTELSTLWNDYKDSLENPERLKYHLSLNQKRISIICS